MTRQERSASFAGRRRERRTRLCLSFSTDKDNNEGPDAIHPGLKQHTFALNEGVIQLQYNASSMDKSNGPAGTNLRPPVKQLRLQLDVHLFAGPT
ncbi:hypothetical protein MTP99_013563 [Tenebrio molitor]|nr:hypothetical protein MTP99_013563 [Tenebrio molitor]